MPTESAVSSLAAVLFDMDGTLVDTEHYWIAAEFDLVAQFGGTWNEDHARALIGSDLMTSGAYIREHGGVDLDPADIVERLIAGVTRAAEQETPWLPGVHELLAQLREQRVPCAMVTMSYRGLAEVVARQLPPGTFAAIVTGDEVSAGKPHPEPYLTAARRLGVRPMDCVAIEDSPTGIASAEAAGCAVVGVANHVSLPAAPGRTLLPTLAGVTVDDLRRLLDR